MGSVGDVINKFLPMVFGTQQGQVAGTIAQSAGLSAASGLSLLKMAAPLVLAHFAKLQSAGSGTLSAIGSALRAEAPSLRSYLPAGLLPAASGVTGAAQAPAAIATSAGGPKWLWPVVIVAALLLGWLVIRSMSGPGQPVRNAANVATEAASAAWAALGEMVKVKLPDGSDLKVPSLGVEARLVRFLSDNSAPVTETSWFDFDRLLFDTGKATLQPASQEQLANVAAILKAFPQVKVRIGGYTDNTGDPAANQQLSQQRADNVMAELTRLGIDASRMSAMGYGQDSPIADNSTEEGRQKNRRISLRITEKPGAPG